MENGKASGYLMWAVILALIYWAWSAHGNHRQTATASQGDVAAQSGENADAIQALNSRVEALESRVDDLENKARD